MRQREVLATGSVAFGGESVYAAASADAGSVRWMVEAAKMRRIWWWMWGG